MKSTLEKTIDCKGKKYRVCSDGEVWKLKHNTKHDRYYHVHLRGFEPTEQPTVHKLVAQAFIPNPENKPEVHHIDGNPANNKVSNLMWVTEEEHNLYHREERTKRIKDNGKHRKLKAVKQIKPNGHEKIWSCAKEVEETLNYSANTIQKVCRGLRETAYGCKWEYTSLS